MKNLFYLFALVLLFNVSLFGQTKQVSYHDVDGELVETSEQSYFYRIISIDEQYPDLRKYQEYYTKDDRLKLDTRLTSGMNTMSRIGECRTYYPNGQLQEKLRYNENHMLIDTAFSYYANGILYAQKFYTGQTEILNDLDTREVDTKYILVQDSLGKIVVTQGNGILPIYDLNKMELLEQGKLSDHKKNGEWSGKANKQTFVETWKEDRLISGITKDSLGVETKYDEQNFAIAPEYPGGTKALRMFVANNYRYPPAAIDNGVSGTIQIEFIVERNGKMTNFKVRNDLGHETGQAAINAISKAKKQWTPGVQRGIPVRVAYVLPITLNLM